MSTVLANTITAVGGGGSTLKMANDATYVSDGGGVTQNTVQGLCKSWVSKVTDGSEMKDSFNVSSMADTATGIFTIVFTNNHNNDDYALSSAVVPVDNTTVITTCEINRQADLVTSGYRGETCYVNSSNNRTDSDNAACVATHGDLA